MWFQYRNVVLCILYVELGHENSWPHKFSSSWYGLHAHIFHWIFSKLRSKRNHHQIYPLQILGKQIPLIQFFGLLITFLFSKDWSSSSINSNSYQGYWKHCLCKRSGVPAIHILETISKTSLSDVKMPTRYNKLK